MTEKTIEFQFQARYYQLGLLNETTRQVWFVLHGYGQLARYFLKKFESLNEHSVCVIAPEGLSRFYLEPVESRAVTGNNRVGATWMTAENRLMDIDNYLHYLDTVYHHVIGSTRKVPVTIVGFSQGAATATRWAIHQPEIFQRLILWAGIFPTDMDFKKAHSIFSTKELVMVYGKQDPYLTDSRLKEITALTEKLNLNPPVITFDGGHEIDQSTLLKFI
jgi:predicted esterase